MSFANLGWPLTLLGLAAIAGGLYLLQRLRVRHRQVPVVTTMFWREAVEESRARVLTKRFRHPWAYALILLIASLLWLALAGPEGGADDETHTVVLLDGSARMARGDAFERAKRAAIDTAAVLPRAAREVVFCGAYPRRVLAPGEDVLLLEKRLEGLAPEACPPTLTTVLRTMTTHEFSAQDFRVVTDSATWQPEGNWPLGRTVTRVDVSSGAGSNRGIVALGVSEAASARFDAVDVFIEVRGGTAVDAAPTLRVSIDGSPIASAPEALPAMAIDATQYWLRDVPAQGGRLSAGLSAGDDLPLDDEASIVLPTRRVARVAIEAALAAVVGPVVDADPALVRDDNGLQPDVLVVRTDLGPGGDIPTLAFVAEGADAPMLHVTHPDVADRGAALLSEVVDALRLDEIDAVELATAAGRPVEVVGDPGAVPALALWESLLTDRYDLVHTRTFPALLARSLRWLAGVERLTPYTAAGEPLAGSTPALVDARGRAHRSLTVSATPPTAGPFTTGGETVVALLASPALTERVTAASDSVETSAAPAFGGSTATWLLLAAFLLLCCEWVLFRTERIP